MNVGAHGRAEKILAVALVLTVPLVALALLAQAAVRDYRTTALEIATLEARRVELLERRRDLDALADLRDRLEQADPQVFGLLVADTVELARVQIQQRVQQIAAANGASMLYVRAIEDAGPMTASAAIALEMPAGALPGFLVDLANAKPLIFVDSLEAQSDVVRSGDETETRLSVDLDLSSYTQVALDAEPEP